MLGSYVVLSRCYAGDSSLNSGTTTQLTGFGVFQEYYTTAWLPGYTTSDISWIGGVQYLFELGLGPVAGRL